MKRTKRRMAYLTAGSLLVSAISSVPVMAEQTAAVPETTQEAVQNQELEQIQGKEPQSQTTTSGSLNLKDTDKEQLLSDFENDNQDGWGSRGSAAVQIVQEERNTTTTGCLYISGRTSNWHGTSKNFTTIVRKGNDYQVGAWVKFKEGGETENMSITLQCKSESEDSTQYKTVANNKEVKRGEWTYFEGTMSIPEDMTSAVLYFEAASPELEFYVDDITVTGDFTGEEIEVGIEQDIPSLKDVYAQYFKFGTAIGNSHLNEVEKELVAKHFNSITCENEMKPESLLDHDATINYMKENGGDQTHPQVSIKDSTRKILDFAQENNIPMRGHVLVWHSQTPNWLFTEDFSEEKGAPLVSKEVMLQRMENYIKAVFETLQEEYPDVEFYAFDVVNEAINPGRPDGMREPAVVAGTTGDDNNNENEGKSMWMTTIGEEFIEKAYEYARKYAPEGVQLAYNDYNECDPVKAEYIYNLCKKLKDQGNLDVIGMQGHHNMNSPSIKQFEAALRKYGSLGIKLEITEMDIMQPDSSEKGMLAQGYRYKEFFDAMKRIEDEGAADIDAVVVWGVKDDESWRKESSPLLFDGDYQSKEAYWAIADPNQLKVMSKEMKGYVTTNETYKEALKVQSGSRLLTAEGKQLADFKVAVSSDKVYVQVEPDSAYMGQKGNLEIWVSGQKINCELTKTQIITISVNQTLQSGSEVSFDISAAYGSERATWNNTYYKGDSNNQYGVVALTQMPQMAGAVKGTPAVDGKIDSVWEQAEVIEVNKFSAGREGATARARMLWDKDNVYVLMEVKDPVLSKASSDAYQQDSVEIFIDEDNAKSATYEEGDVQYRVNFENEQSVNGTADPELFKTATQVTEDGYIVEAAIPTLMGGLNVNQVLGFDLQVNDDADGNGRRDNVSNWNDMSGNGWSSTAGYGLLELREQKADDSSDDDDNSSSTATSSSSNSNSSNKAQTIDEVIVKQLSNSQHSDIRVSMNGELKLAADTVQALSKAGSHLIVNDNKVTFNLAPAFFKENFNSQGTLALTAASLKEEEFNPLKKQLESSSIYPAGGTDLTRKIEVSGTEAAQFEEPVQISFNLNNADLNTARKLTVVKYEKDKEGKWQAVKLGGAYDAKADTLTAYITQPGIYGAAETDSLLTLSLTIGKREIKVNNESRTSDAAPQIINGRTMVPLRIIAENLGVQVKWNEKDKEITLISEDKAIQMRIGEKIAGYDAAPVIQNGRTLVPAAYVAEQLGANVTWIPSVKGIEITK